MTGARDQLDVLLAELDAGAGLRTQENGVCILVFDGGVTQVNLLADEGDGSVVLWSPVGTAPEADRAQAYRRMLVANLFWRETDGGTLGLEPEHEQLVLAMRRPLTSLDVDGLRQAVEQLVERAEALRAQLAIVPDGGRAGMPAGSAAHLIIRG